MLMFRVISNKIHLQSPSRAQAEISCFLATPPKNLAQMSVTISDIFSFIVIKNKLLLRSVFINLMTCRPNYTWDCFSAKLLRTSQA